MHHVYTRRIVVALVIFFTVLAVIFGNLVVSLRDQFTPAVAAAVAGDTPAEAATLPNGETVFNNYCASCHQLQVFADKITDSLDADAASRAQLEKLIGPPAHGGISPAEALAVVISIRTLAGLPSTYPESVPTPAAAATAAAAEPVPTPVPWADLSPTDFEGVYNQYCRACHQPETFSEGLAKVPDPNIRSRQAINYLSGPPPHQNLPVEAFKPAVNYLRSLVGLEAVR